MAFLFFAVLLLIVYGSLYPFDFTVAALESATAGQHFYSWDVFSSRGDVLGNIALFLPYGFVGMLALPSRRPFAADFVPLAMFGVMVAVGVQILQLFLPARDAALSDVLWNVLGMTLGAWMAALRPVQDALRTRAGVRAEIVPLALVACWFAAELAPFVPSIDLQSFKDSLKPLLLAPAFGWLELFRAFVAWLVVGFLASRLLAPRLAWRWLLAGMVGLLAAKVVIVQNVVTLSDVVAIAMAFPAWLLLQRLVEPRTQILLALLIALIVAAALEPFNLRMAAREFSWLPFSGSLGGSMLINAKVIAEKTFLIGSVLYLAAACGLRHRITVVLVAAFLAILELAQIWIGEHTPEITDPLLALLLGVVLAALTRDRAAPAVHRSVAGRMPPPHGSASVLARAGVVESRLPFLSRADAAMLVAGCAAIVIAMQAILGLPGIPYNVSELFEGENAWWKLVLFALAVLSIGMGGAAAGRLAARSPRPYLVLPGTAALACLVTFGLLAASTSAESIEDILGAPNIHDRVVNEYMWGAAGARLFSAPGSSYVISALELAVRFLALVGPLYLWLAIASATYLKATGEGGVRRAADVRLVFSSALLYALSALPWLVLCKLIAFDYSSTDNLNELLEAGGYVLYGLLVLLPAVAVAIVHATRTRRTRDVAAALLVVGVSLPVGWFLFKCGLAPEVHKYGHVFSGVDFLLGPDREELLPESVLMLRWYAVQLAVLAVLAYGMRIVTPAARRVAGVAMA